MLAGMLGLTAPLAACNIIPPEGPSLLAQRPDRNFGPSAQRLDKDGYPLLGAFPNQAAPQLDSAAVASDRQSLLASGRAQNAEVRSAAAEYQQSVAQAKKIRAQHEANVTELTSIEVQQNAARKTNDDVLRQIEGR
ncbi:hypothetical protein GCM10011390_06930 [Aureimonas endophytica]|uniref:Uncharacterized protein n=1 Tax=Aureimonas endophytica TaxID=2027858 RepID=A0A917E168_9HYPH|nr:hypothetical protein GCM10011390_06930 [Aureimonas endophytica]